MKCSGDEKSLKPNYKVKRSGSVKTSGDVITSQRKRRLVVSRPVIREPQGDDGPMLEASRQRYATSYGVALWHLAPALRTDCDKWPRAATNASVASTCRTQGSQLQI